MCGFLTMSGLLGYLLYFLSGDHDGMAKKKQRYIWLCIIGIACMLVLWSILPRVKDFANYIFLRTEKVSYGVVETIHHGQGVVVRSEQVIKAPMDGNITFLVKDAQRVRSGQIVAEISENISGWVEEKLLNIKDLIKSLDKHSVEQANQYKRQLEQLEIDKHNIQQSLDNALEAGHDRRANELGAELRSINDQIESVSSEYAAMRKESEAERKVLVNQKESVVASRSGDLILLRSPEAGMVTFSYDGWEGRFVPGQVSDELWAAVDEQVSFKAIGDGQRIDTDTPVFRLIDNFVVHLFALVQGPITVRSGQTVWLSWEEDGEATEIPGRILSIHSRLDKIGIWVNLSVFREELAHLRMLDNLAMVVDRYEGVVVPKEAITYRGERPGIYLLVEGSPVFRYVNVTGGNDQSVVIDRVPPGTNVVVNPERLAQR